jgi:hypothetical protein
MPVLLGFLLVAWYLLMIVSVVLVGLVNKPEPMEEATLAP